MRGGGTFFGTMGRAEGNKRLNQQSPRSRRSAKLYMILALLAVAAVAVLLYAGGRWLETRTAAKQTRGELSTDVVGQTIEVDGVAYRRRQNLTAILVMGVDKSADTTAAGTAWDGGQADFQRLVVIDKENETVRQLEIDRDTMTEITVLSMLGDISDTRVDQICLSHSYGDGAGQSCQYAVQAVEGLLNGESVDLYLAMDLDGISILNDLAGGVTVTLEDDFSSIDPAMTKGVTLTLVGDQAETFVRSRMSIGVGTNEARMARQEQYMTQLLRQLDEKMRQDKQFINTAYEALLPYLVTDIAKGRLVNEIWAAKDYTRAPVLSLSGEHMQGDGGFVEFYPTEASVQQAVLELFYDKV